MSSTSTPNPSASRSPAASVAGALAQDLTGYAVFWAAIVAVLVVAVATLESGFGTSTVDSSLWQAVGSLVRWVVLVGGVIVTRSYVPLYVAHGVSRRHVLRGTAPVLLGLTVVLGVATAVGFAVEGLIFGALGWEHRLPDESNRFLYDSPDQYGLIVVGTAAAYLGYLVTGAIAGSAFSRWGPAGAFLLPVAVLPVSVAELSAGGGWAAEVSGIDIGLPAPTALAVTALACAAGAAVVAVILRAIPLDNDNVAWWR
jgi:hypothetical protein